MTDSDAHRPANCDWQTTDSDAHRPANCGTIRHHWQLTAAHWRAVHVGRSFLPQHLRPPLPSQSLDSQNYTQRHD